MSTFTSRLSAGIKSNPLIAGSIVVGVVGLVSIAAVMAWSNPVPAAITTTQKPAVVSQDKKALANDDKQTTVDTQSTNTGDVAYSGDTVTAPTVNNTSAVQSAGSAAQVQVASASTQTTDNSNTGTGVNQPSTGNNGGTTTPANPTGPVVVPTDPTTPINPGTPADPTTCPAVVSTTDPAYTGARVSLTFDDGWKSIFTNGLPILQKYCLASTQYINSQPTMDSYSGYVTYDQIAAFQSAGSEIAWHTNTHNLLLQDINTVDQATLTAELNPNATFVTELANRGVTLSNNYAAPFGTRSDAAVATAAANGFTTYRTTDDGYNLKGSTDFTSIKVKNVCGVAGIEACGGLKTTAAEVASWLAQAKIDNSWVVIVFHEVAYQTTAEAAAAPTGKDCDADPADSGYIAGSCTADQSYAVTPTDLDAMLAEVKASGVKVQTVKDAVSDLKQPQL